MMAGGQLSFDAFGDEESAPCPVPPLPKPKHSEPEILTVSQLAARIVAALNTPRLNKVLVSGEITGYRPHSSGHLYFSLSEHDGDAATIPCIMWKSTAKTLSFTIGDGVLVQATGHVEYYPPFGKLQFIIKKLEPALSGKAGLYLQKELWKKQLEEEGIIPRKEADKRCLPLFPGRIGVVTSRTGSVLQDIRTVIGRRYPLPILLAHTGVQGDAARKEIVNAITLLQGKADVIIVARGGGSFEDLFIFNHPDVVRAIAFSKVPVISAIGHETDTTLADFAADVRAPTPSAAAETAVPDRAALFRNLEEFRRIMYDRMGARISAEKRQISDFSQRIDAGRLFRKLDQMRGIAAEFAERISSAMNRKLSAGHELCLSLRQDLSRAMQHRLHAAGLELSAEKETILARDPYKPLNLGYALVFRNGTAVRSVRQIAEQDHLSLRFGDGEAAAVVEEIYDRTE